MGLSDEDRKRLFGAIGHPASNRTPPKRMDFKALEGREPPAREWLIPEWLPARTIALMVGKGGVGKTLLALQLAACLATGREFLGASGKPRTVLMWACEDDHDELWRRLAAITYWLKTPLAQFDGHLVISPRHGEENSIFVTEYGHPVFTRAFGQLSEEANACGAEVLILDNTAQLFGANENDRHHVTVFLNALAGEHPNRTILLLAHPAKNPGSEFSGSTAWENAARTRLYLGNRLPGENGDETDEPDADVRYLCRRKANYSTRDYRRFNYANGVLIPETVSPGEGGPMGAMRAKSIETTVMNGITTLAARSIFCTEGQRSDRYLPRQLGRYHLLNGFSHAEIIGAMHRLILNGKLTTAPVGKDAGYRVITGLVTPPPKD